MERLTASDFNELAQICPGGVERDVNLSAISQWRIGGRADVIVRPSSVYELIVLRRWLFTRGLPHVVIGQTTNLLFSDDGLRVPCLQIGPSMGQIKIKGTEAIVEAGAWVPCLARRLMVEGLTGAEHICGIPGTLGGLICMNGGSQRKGIGSCVIEVESVTIRGETIIRNAAECDFRYRHSVYQTNQEVITSARLQFNPADRNTIRKEMCLILAERRNKFPRKEPNCGSVFKSNPMMYSKVGPPGVIIERLGLKGHSLGGASVSSLHANFIVNRGHALANEVLQLISQISKAVATATGFKMETEVLYVTPEGKIIPVDKVQPAMFACQSE